MLALWLAPLAVGGSVALNTGGDEQMIILFVTGLTALMYVITVTACSTTLVVGASGPSRWPTKKLALTTWRGSCSTPGTATLTPR